MGTSNFTSLLASDIGFMSVEPETTYGTDPATDPIYLNITEQPDVTELREQIERARVKPSVGGDPNAIHEMAVEGSFQTTIAPVPFSDGATPAVAPILKAGGFTESTSGSTSSTDVTATYTLRPRDFGSVTLKFYIPDKNSTSDYTRIIVTGARCNPTLTYNATEELLLDVDFKGLYDEWSSITDYSSDEPPQLHQGETAFTTPDQSFSFGSTNTDISNFELDVAMTFQDLESAVASEMVQEVALQKDGKHSGSFDPFATSVGQTDDAKDLARKANQVSMSLNVTDNSGDKEFNVTAPSAEITEAPMSESNGHYRYDVSYQLNETGVGADDDLTLEFKSTA